MNLFRTIKNYKLKMCTHKTRCMHTQLECYFSKLPQNDACLNISLSLSLSLHPPPPILVVSFLFTKHGNLIDGFEIDFLQSSSIIFSLSF